jgi:hypothetical protein
MIFSVESDSIFKFNSAFYSYCQKYVPILLCPLGKSALSFQERADLPSEYWDLVHHGIGTYF